ncbi:MAG: FGGY-family carbohydrate kinase [Pseudomonadota bacterium]
MRLVSEAEDGAARHILHQADFIAAKLTGLGGVSDHNNALKTGFDPETERWPDWVDNVIDPDVLPEARPVGAMLGPVLPQWIDHFGFSKHAQVHCGTTDSIAAFLAAAPLGVGHAVTSIGSTLAIKLLSPSRIDDPSIGLYSHKLGDHWLVGGASNAGGAVLSHYFEVDEIIALSAQMDPERPTGLNYYPLLEPGERFPVNDPELAPVLTPRPEKDVVFLQGVFEGLAAIETRCYGAMVERGAGFPAKIFTAGGASKNAVLTAIRQKALGVKLYEAIHTEAAVGVAKVWKLAQAAG